MTELGGSYHAGDYPILGLIDVPYLFTNELEKYQVWEAVRPIIQREFLKEDIVILSYFPRFLQAFNTDEAVDLMDLKGKKIRSYAAHIGMIIEAMGGTAVPVAWPEVYTALERGVANGLLTGADAIYANKFYEVVPYTYDVGLLHGIWLVSVNKGLWDQVPGDIKDIVYQELGAWQGLSINIQAIEEKKIFDLMLEAGAKGFESAPPEFYDLMREEVTTPMLADLLEKTGPVGEELVTAIEQALGKTLR
jgi:TRAP-type C4-dicarboxylate transport system substrate-binding protein